MASLKSISTLIFFVFFLFVDLSCSTAKPSKRDQDRTKPCKTFTFYFHDIIYNGENAKNSTSAIIGTPAWGNKVEFSGQYRFGDLVAFDGPITLDNNLHSNPIGRAQGFYLYNSKETFSAWLSVSFVFRSKQLNGSFNFAGSDPLLEKTRDISIVGGTGDFFMARGIATLMTDAFEVPLYFRLRVDVKLFECW